MMFYFAKGNAQPRQASYKSYLSIEAGSSKAGSGDLGGVMVTNLFTHQINEKTHYSFGLGFSINQSTGNDIYTATTGEVIDATLRKVTAGLQIVGKYGKSILKLKKHDFGISAGGLIRYQATSINDFIATYPPSFFQDFPFRLSVIKNTEPQQKLAAGASLNLFYNYNISKRILIGIVPAFQLDTNGDTFRSISLKLGYRF